ncbi:MAG: glycosyltransferase [Prevotellaceae bacterium]|jgi:cellulose synthase/poly-beta-1,6-N-acetylglucosamine synthase-like glycosyltransferase|nr:glycosyltransferase [Prevotellaceae bacterium]
MMIVFAYIIIGLYAVFVLVCAGAWRRRKPFTATPRTKLPSLAVVVCCRNEQERIPALLQSLSGQIMQAQEVIFANDHSTDRTEELLTNFAANYQHVKLFNCTGLGKKNALREAIERTGSNLIFCTDADCILPQNHLAIIKNYMAAHQCGLLIGGVKLAHSDKLFERLQAAEFASLIAATAGAAMAAMPIMCNGANLTFTRAVWQAGKEHLNDDELSGDDVFLLHHAKRSTKIDFLKAPDAFVTTTASTSLLSFFEQRKRWSSKSRAYADPQTVTVAGLVFLVAALQVGFGFAAIFLPTLWTVTVLMFCLKFLTDCLLLVPFLRFSKQEKLIPLLLPVALLYPFYIILTAIAGLFGQVRWR